MPSELVFEIELDAGTHAYCIEVRRARNGSRFLQVMDYQVEEDGVEPSKGLIVFDDHAIEFLWAFTKAIVQLDEPDTDRRAPDNSLDAIRSRYPRAYRPWSDGEGARIRLAWSQGDSTETIARALQRQPSAIRSRLRRLGAI